MPAASERPLSRRDGVTLVLCVAVGLVLLLVPPSWGQSIAAALRESVLAPLVWLQERAEEGRTSRARFERVAAQRDSAALAAQSVPVLRAENTRLRDLLGLQARLRTGYVAADVLHQAQPTDSRMLLIDAGSAEGVAPFQPVVAPEGLIGVVAHASRGSATVMTWAHPEFRVSAFTADGRVFGIVAPSSNPSTSESALEFRAASYRDTLRNGTVVLTSGLGGVYPKGIPVGRVTGIAREQEGWERIYALRPAAAPSIAGQVLVLTGSAATPVGAAFPSDSILAALRADSLRRRATADSLLRVRIADSVRRVLADSAGRRVEARDSVVRPAARRAARPAAGPPPVVPPDSSSPR